MTAGSGCAIARVRAQPRERITAALPRSAKVGVAVTAWNKP